MDGEIHRFRLENPEFQIPERTKENTLHITHALLHSLMWKPRPRMCVGERGGCHTAKERPQALNAVSEAAGIPQRWGSV